MRKTSWLEAACLTIVCAGTAQAQDAAPAPATTAPAAGAAVCVPECRAGYVCIDGRCLSACNPPCPAGQSCTADRRCAATPATTTAPAATSAPAPKAAEPAPAAAERRPEPSWTTSYTTVARRDENYESVSANERRRQGIYYHDGFYFRFGVGGGYVYGQVGDAPGGDVVTRGITVPFELAMGGTPVAGIVLGVGSYGLVLPALNYDFDGGSDESANPGLFTAIGPFVDFYVRPAFGMHLQASPTLVIVDPGKSDSLTGDLSGLGYGAMLGAGYEIWVAKQWSGGWLLRVQGAKVTLEDDDGNEYDYVSILPSLLFTITLH